MSETKSSLQYKLNQLDVVVGNKPAEFTSTVAMPGIPTHANDGAAGTAGLVTGDLFILTATAAVTVKA